MILTAPITHDFQPIIIILQFFDKIPYDSMPASRSYNIGQPKDVPVDAITITVR